MARAILREQLAAGKFVAAPGIHDMIAAVIANDVGFDVVYGTGFWLTASAYGLPDAGIASVTQMTDRMATLVETSDAAVIADADTGYGGLLNVHHTVRAYEKAGVTALQIEDQDFPKKCGHTPGKRLVSCEDMVRKIQVACDARESEDFLIVARTDCRQSEGIDGVLRRMEAYAKAGADILFPEALASEEEMRRVCATVDRPMIANMVSGGVTPLFNAEQLKDMGFAIGIYPSMTALAAGAAIEAVLRNLKATGDGETPAIDMFDFKRFQRLIGFEEVWAFDRKWAEDQPA